MAINQEHHESFSSNSCSPITQVLPPTTYEIMESYWYSLSLSHLIRVMKTCFTYESSLGHCGEGWNNLPPRGIEEWEAEAEETRHRWLILLRELHFLIKNDVCYHEDSPSTADSILQLSSWNKVWPSLSPVSCPIIPLPKLYFFRLKKDSFPLWSNGLHSILVKNLVN